MNPKNDRGQDDSVVVDSNNLDRSGIDHEGSVGGTGKEIPVADLRVRAFEAVSEPMFTLRTDGNIVDVNQAACDCVGYSRDELLGMSFEDLVDSRSVLTSASHYNSMLKRKSGETLHAELTVRLFESHQEQFISVGVRTSRQGAFVEQELQQILDSLPAFISYVDSDQRYRYANAAYENNFGISCKDICGMKVRDVIGEELYEDHRERIEAAIGGTAATFEVMLPAPVPKQYMVTLQPGSNNDGYFVIGTDITAIKNAEAGLIESEMQLRNAQNSIKDLRILAHRDRLTSMGEMASAIAHELNQPLMVISGMAYVLEEVVSQDAISVRKTKEIAGMIAGHAVQAGEIVHRMRGFVSNKNQSREKCDLNEIIRETVKMLQARLTDSNIGVRLNLDPRPGMISADPVQIQQVFVNLILNAAEALSDQPLSDRWIRIFTSTASASNVRACVNDSGPGVPPKQRENLFNAFESTKKNGMGMGLAISRSLIESHNGELQLDRQYTPGASFVISLPRCEQETS